MSPDRSARPGRPPVPPRSRPADRMRLDADRGRTAPPRREPIRSGDRPSAAARPSARPARAAADRGATARSRGAAAPATTGGTVRGFAAVLGVFLVTLAGAGIDSYVGIGLGMITLVTLVGSTVVAALSVRRRDLVTVVVAPPLVFIGVAALNIGLAPSASFSLPTVATLLIRGFPTMAMATAAALVIALGRAVTRR